MTCFTTGLASGETGCETARVASLLCYRAGERALQRVRERGLGPAQVRALIAPAAGPKWLAVAGLDRALIEAGYLRGRAAPLLLLGASAGAWRSVALAARDPEAAHRRLTEAYCAQRFVRADRPAAISAAYARLLEHVLADADAGHALAHPDLDLAILVARGQLGAASDVFSLQAAALGLAALLNAVHGNSGRLFFTRTLFTSAHAERATHPLLAGIAAERVALSHENLRAALLASGTVPFYMAPVRGLAGATPGGYLDGGLTDYHVNQPLELAGEGVALMFLHQARIVPSWFDKSLPWRAPSAQRLRDLLLVHPDPAWIASLPGGAVPTREDFQRFEHEPEARIERWLEAVKRSEELGAQWLQDVRSGEIAAKVTGF
jgi:hypothetical protein